MDIVLVEIRQTCVACPSQWSGKTTGGKVFYARYRHGMWEIRLDGKTVASGLGGYAIDGCCSFGELQTWAAAEGCQIKEAV